MFQEFWSKFSLTKYSDVSSGFLSSPFGIRSHICLRPISSFSLLDSECSFNLDFSAESFNPFRLEYFLLKEKKKEDIWKKQNHSFDNYFEIKKSKSQKVKKSKSQRVKESKSQEKGLLGFIFEANAFHQPRNFFFFFFFK